MNELPFMAEGPAGLRFLCCIPVHPARLRNDRLRQVSWLPDQRLAPPSQSAQLLGLPSGMWRFGSPVTVAGAAGDWNPLPS